MRGNQGKKWGEWRRRWRRRGEQRLRAAESLKQHRGACERQDKHWQAESGEEGACGTWEAAASLASGGESVTLSHTGTHVDKLLLPLVEPHGEGAAEEENNPKLEEEDEEHRCHLTHTGSEPQYLRRQSEHSLSYQGDWGRQRESCWDYARGSELLWIPHLWQR